MFCIESYIIITCFVDSVNTNVVEETERQTWTYDETMCLIQSMAVHMEDLNHAKKRKFVFVNISNDLLSNKFSKSALSCQNKWKNLLRSYKAAKDQKVKTGRGASRFHFYEQIDELLGEKPTNKCLHALESSCTSTDIDEVEALTEDEEIVKVQPRRKRRTSGSVNLGEVIRSREEEYVKKQKRHEEKVALFQQQLALEKEKIEILKKLITDC